MERGARRGAFMLGVAGALAVLAGSGWAWALGLADASALAAQAGLPDSAASARAGQA